MLEFDDDGLDGMEDMANEDEEGREGEGGDSQRLWSKTRIVFLLDCHPNMHLQYIFRNDNSDAEGEEDTTEDSYFTRACKHLHTLCREKVKKGRLDHVGLVLFNSHDTDNKWNHDSCKTEIELKELGKETIDHLAELMSNPGKVQGHADLQDKHGNSHLELGLKCSTAIFGDSDEINAQKSIYILTCNDDIGGSSAGRAAGKMDTAQDQCLQKVKDCVEQGIIIDVWPLSDAHSLVDDGPMPPKFKPTAFFEQLLGHCIDESSIFAVDKQEEIRERLEMRGLDYLHREIEALSSRSQASLQWTIVPSSEQTRDEMPLKIAVKFFSLALEAKKPTAAKVYRRTNQLTKTITERLCAATGRVLDAQQVESYFPFGGDTVSLSKEEQEKMKTMDIAAGIMTLGFAPREKVVKPELCLRPCWLMRPDDTKAKNSSTTFRAFLQVLKDKDEVVLCCIRKRSNDAPRLHALVPQTEVREGRDILAPEGFHVVPLPFADDIRNLPPGFSISKEDEPDEDAVELAAKLVKRVKNERVLRRLECALDLVNPSLLKQFAHVEAHALGSVVNEADPVTNLEEATTLLDPPVWFQEGERGKKLQEMAEQLKGAIDNSYDTLIASKAAGGKRKRDPEAAEKANAKKEEAANVTASIDWRAELEANTLKKRTVPQLKAYCDANGLSTKGKKDELLERVTKHLEDGA